MCLTIVNCLTIAVCYLQRHAWSLFIILMLALTSIILPLEIAFYQVNSLLVTSSTSTDYELPHWEALSIIMSVIFFIDIVIRFRTGHVQSETDDVSYWYVDDHHCFSCTILDLY